MKKIESDKDKKIVHYHYHILPNFRMNGFQWFLTFIIVSITVHGIVKIIYG